MTRKVKSMRGEEIDFDLFDIKNKILQAPKTEPVEQRERFINKKRRKSSKKRVDELMHQTKLNAEAKALQASATPVATVEPTPAEVEQAEKQTKRKIVKNESKAD